MYEYLIIINALCFLLFGYDKKQAIKKQGRIPEITLIILSFMGGSIGSLLGMQLFHHKTKKIKFIILIPLSIIFTLLIIFLHWLSP